MNLHITGGAVLQELKPNARQNSYGALNQIQMHLHRILRACLTGMLNSCMISAKMVSVPLILINLLLCEPVARLSVSAIIPHTRRLHRSVLTAVIV